jgi:endonuclease YncB( thermonuclease family)
MVLSLRTLIHPVRGRAAMLAAAMFASGVTVGALTGADLTGRTAKAGTQEGAPPVVVSTNLAQATLRAAHAAEVLRVLDGDTFEARVSVWPGIEITTKVRLRGIDAPELRARCADEFVKAQAARDALIALLAEGAVGISRVALDKYGGRVVADASTRKTADISTALLHAGLVRSYQGGRRESWCEGDTAISRQ